MVSGESHYFLGDRYLLDVIPHQGKPYITLKDRTHINLYVKLDTTTEHRSQLIQKWYREQLKSLIPTLLDNWTAIVGVENPEWNIKKMKTKWGSCNIKASRIWLNLELAKKPIHCLEYVIVHELIHLHERNHSDRFKALMDKVMPQWKLFRDELNQLPLAHDSWG